MTLKNNCISVIFVSKYAPNEVRGVANFYSGTHSIAMLRLSNYGEVGSCIFSNITVDSDLVVLHKFLWTHCCNFLISKAAKVSEAICHKSIHATK